MDIKLMIQKTQQRLDRLIESNDKSVHASDLKQIYIDIIKQLKQQQDESR